MTASITHLNEYRAGRAKMVPEEMPAAPARPFFQPDPERHTVDIDRAPMAYQAPEKVSKGAIWAWVAMGALLAVYCVWLWRMK